MNGQSEIECDIGIARTTLDIDILIDLDENVKKKNKSIIKNSLS